MCHQHFDLAQGSIAAYGQMFCCFPLGYLTALHSELVETVLARSKGGRGACE